MVLIAMKNLTTGQVFSFSLKVNLTEGLPYFNTEIWRVCVSMNWQVGQGTNYKSRGNVDL